MKELFNKYILKQNTTQISEIKTQQIKYNKNLVKRLTKKLDQVEEK